MKRCLYILALLLASPLWGIEGAAYLKNNEGVRSSALAGAFAAVAGSAESLWYNPAGLSGLRGFEASFTRASIENAFDSDHIVAAAFLGWDQSLGLLYSRKGAMDSYRDNSANSIGSFEVSNSVMGIAYAYDLEWLSLGLGLKYLSEKVEKLSGSSMAWDLGAQGNFDHGSVIYGVSLQNLGSAPQLGGPEISTPLNVRSSLGWRMGDLSQQLLFLSEYRYFINNSRGALALAAEYSETYDRSMLAIRTGWDFGQNQLGGTSGLSLGAGFGYKFWSLDYAWLPLDVLGSSHKIALTLVYDQKAIEREKSVATYLDIDPNAAVLPTPTPAPAPKYVAPSKERNVGAELSALLAETPSPTPTHTPEVRELAKEKPKGIIGAIFSAFSFGKKEESKEGTERKGGLLKGLFGIFGLSGGSDDDPIAAPDMPAKPESKDSEDEFVDPSKPGAARPGGSSPQPTPTLQPTPVLKKLKGWLSF